MITIKNVQEVNGKRETIVIPSHTTDHIDGTGLTAIPALIDPHVHFRTPGAENKEDWITGAQAAVSGGVTTVIDMPNNTPACTSLKELQNKHQLILRQLQESGIPLRYFLYFGADRNNLREIPKVKHRAVGIKIFMGSSTGSLLIDDEATLDEIFRIAADQDMLVSVHAEDEKTIQKNKLAIGYQKDPSWHSKIRTPEAAKIAVERALSLAIKYQTRLCILHVSTRDELSLIKQAKCSNSTIFAEVAPHHLLLSNADYAAWGTRIMVNPPLREIPDQYALWDALNNGIIDFIGSDHAPHTIEEKNLPFGKAPSGIPSVELLLPLLVDAAGHNKTTLETIVKATRTNIEKIFRIPSHNDVVLLDLNKTQQVKDSCLKTKCKWSPYHGRVLKGWPVYTIIQGNVLCLNKPQ